MTCVKVNLYFESGYVSAWKALFNAESAWALAAAPRCLALEVFNHFNSAFAAGCVEGCI